MILRELTAPVSLTNEQGLLNPESVGWARQPLVTTAGINGRTAWGRNKRWEYWNVITPTHILALTVSSLDYATVNDVWVFDRATSDVVHLGKTNLGSGSVVLPATLGDGPARAKSGTLKIDIVEEAGGTRLKASIPGASFDVFAERPEGHESLAVVVPWSTKRFQYTVKDVARPASGSVTIHGRTYPVPAGQSWAVLDHGRGRWPYDIAWNWGAGSGTMNGRVIGLQVGDRWTDGTGSTENSVLVGTTLYKIHEKLQWSYDLDNWADAWRIIGGGLNATLRPFYNKESSMNLGVLSNRTDQCFGYWSGTFDTGSEVVEFENIVGFAEDVHNRW